VCQTELAGVNIFCSAPYTRPDKGLARVLRGSLVAEGSLDDRLGSPADGLRDALTEFREAPWSARRVRDDKETQ
jgi:hypothetical protein